MSQFINFLTKHSTLVIGLLTVIFGTGIITNCQENAMQQSKYYDDNRRLQVVEHQKLSALKNDIIEISNEFISSVHAIHIEGKRKHDSFEDQEADVVEIKHKLLTKIDEYNRIEFLISEIEDRLPLFVNPLELFSFPVSRVNEPDEDIFFDFHGVLFSITNFHDRHFKDLILGVISGIDKIIKPKGKSYLRKYLILECNTGNKWRCSDLALFRTRFQNNDNQIAFSPNELVRLKTACDAGDGFACHNIAFHYIRIEKPKLAIIWSSRACNLLERDACGLTGSIYLSKIMKGGRDFEKAIRYTSIGCLLTSGNSCYILGIISLTGNVSVNKTRARSVLYRGCSFGSESSCIAQEHLESISNCEFSEFEETIENIIYQANEVSSATFSVPCVNN